MKERNGIKRIVLVLCILCGPMMFPAHAHDSVKHLQQEIAAMSGQVDKAVIIIVPATMSFRRRMQENDLPAIGCRYELENQEAVVSLMRLLEKSHFTADPMPERKLDIKLGIYLYQADALKARLIFEQAMAYTQDEALATGDARGSYNSDPVAAIAPFAEDIRTLVSRMQTAGPNFYCDFARK